MKTLKYLLMALLVLVGLFFGNGMVNSTVEYQNDVQVNATNLKTWYVMGDTSKMGLWLPGFKRLEHVSGRPQTVGAVSHIYFEENGEEGRIVETITDVALLRSLAMDFDTDYMKMKYEVSTSSDGEKTQIKSSSIVTSENFFFKSLFVLMPSMLQEQEQTNLVNLKKAIENN